MSEENKAIVRRLYCRVWSLGDLDVVDEAVSADFVGYRPGRSNILGPEGVKEDVLRMCKAFPDGKFTIEDIVAEGDRVAVRYTARATHRGEFRGMAPTGKEIRVAGMAVYRIARGQIVERWDNLDQLGLMQQLGAIQVGG